MSRSRQIPEAVVSAIQAHFHAVIRGRVGELIERHKIRMPELAELLASGELEAWFPLPLDRRGLPLLVRGRGR